MWAPCIAPNSSVTFRLRRREVGWGAHGVTAHPEEGHTAWCSSWLSVGHDSRPLLAPHFLDPGFLGLGVSLAYGEKGGHQCPAPSLRPWEDQPLLPALTFFTGLLSLTLGLKQGGVRWGRGGGEMRVGKRESSAGYQ